MTNDLDLRTTWAAGRPAHGLWSLLPGAVTAEVLARTGADYVVVDLQHGAVSEAELPGITAAIRAAGSVPLVRTRSSSFPDVGRPLDLGADGVIVPNIRECRARSRGRRVGPVRARRGRSIGRLAGGADQPLVILMVEMATALDELDDLLAVDGLDGIYVGPATSRCPSVSAARTMRDELRAVLSSIIARAVAAGVPVGVHAYTGEDARSYAAEGATIVTVAVDTVSLGQAMAQHLDAARTTS